FGHGPSTCPKRAKEEAPKAPPMAATRPSSMENQEDGFVEVTVRRNKGKKAANQQANYLIAGIRIHKPKSSFYRPINKHGDGTKVTSLSRVKPGFTTPLSNPFDVLSAVEEDLCGPNYQNPKESEPVVISLTGDGFSFDEEDLDCYDGYEAQVYDLTPQEQALCDQYDIFLNSRGLGIEDDLDGTERGY
nr:hypothetical protein [Tanacetum cinerariifolium]